MKTKRRVLLVELDAPLNHPTRQTWSAREVEKDLQEKLGSEYGEIKLWGSVGGIDGAYRKLRQLSAETEKDRSKNDRVHSAHKALSFFRDMFPQRFWEEKRIGGSHPTREERPIAGR